MWSSHDDFKLRPTTHWTPTCLGDGNSQANCKATVRAAVHHPFFFLSFFLFWLCLSFVAPCGLMILKLSQLRPSPQLHVIGAQHHDGSWAYVVGLDTKQASAKLNLGMIIFYWSDQVNLSNLGRLCSIWCAHFFGLFIYLFNWNKLTEIMEKGGGGEKSQTLRGCTVDLIASESHFPSPLPLSCFSHPGYQLPLLSHRPDHCWASAFRSTATTTTKQALSLVRDAQKHPVSVSLTLSIYTRHAFEWSPLTSHGVIVSSSSPPSALRFESYVMSSDDSIQLYALSLYIYMYPWSWTLPLADHVSQPVQFSCNHLCLSPWFCRSAEFFVSRFVALSLQFLFVNSSVCFLRVSNSNFRWLWNKLSSEQLCTLIASGLSARIGVSSLGKLGCTLPSDISAHIL